MPTSILKWQGLPTPATRGSQGRWTTCTAGFYLRQVSTAKNRPCSPVTDHKTQPLPYPHYIPDHQRPTASIHPHELAHLHKPVANTSSTSRYTTRRHATVPMSWRTCTAQGADIPCLAHASLRRNPAHPQLALSATTDKNRHRLAYYWRPLIS